MADLGREAGIPSPRTQRPVSRRHPDDRYPDDADFESIAEDRDYATYGDGEDVMTMGVKGW